MTTEQYSALDLKLGDIVTITLTNGKSITGVHVDSNTHYEVPAKYYYDSPESGFPPRIAVPATPPSILYTDYTKPSTGASQLQALDEVESITIIEESDD